MRRGAGERLVLWVGAVLTMSAVVIGFALRNLVLTLSEWAVGYDQSDEDEPRATKGPRAD